MKHLTRSLCGIVLAIAPMRVTAQDVSRSLPFAPGERLTYAVRVAGFGTVGHGTMWIDGTADVRGTQTWVLRFETRVGAGFVRGIDRTASWLDPVRFAALRFTKYERHLVSSRSDSVELFPDERRWSTAAGASGDSPSDAPLDELSFIYFLRTLPLGSESAWELNRHFDAARNPTTVCVIGTERITTPAGAFEVTVVEMTVRDPAHYRGEGRLRLSFTNDSLRVPVRIESRLPVVGSTTLLLESRSVPAPSIARARR